ncbi:hypothetical protein AVDCRST_MAG84-2032 [uncultured Microcoleus sp.]|uniref:Uncharacterized protein n=1 Tax=uncultured Microcoleus sp. TaxID=259945 RepID=A0A6J4LL70_9CYAN|nr:hypothetical protein AVDCRST_MAG84-2032 [uncultured Microcoleus sp.]
MLVSMGDSSRKKLIFKQIQRILTEYPSWGSKKVYFYE